MSRFAAIIKRKSETVGMPEVESNVELLAAEDAGQPVFNSEKTIAIVFDGEIYNSKALKKELITGEHKSCTQTDAEVVIQAYEQFGIELLLNKLDGAFAFSIYDIAGKTVYIARDKFGIKPLYYFQNTTGLYAASTLKLLSKNTFPKVISKEGLNLFFSLSYIPAPYTIYENVFKLPAGNYISIHNDNVAIKTYYKLEDYIKPSTLTFEQAKEQLKQMLIDSVKNCMDGDFPTGAFLSGGIDSSVVVGLMSQCAPKPVPTFSIGFEEKEYDESDRAQLVSNTFKTNHTVHFLDYADIMHVLDDIIDYFDEPYGDSSAIPSYYVAKLASEKIKVVLTGDCSDELFGGYKKFLSEYYTNKYLSISKPVRYLFEKTVYLAPSRFDGNSFVRKTKKLVTNAACSKFEVNYRSMCMGCSDKVRLQLVSPEFYVDTKPVVEKAYNRFNGNDSLNRAMFTDICISLEGDMFPKMERMCMMNSLIARSPFSGADMVHFAMSLPAAYKVNGKKKKYILREAFKDLLPAKVYAYGKRGFRAPIAHWLRKELKQDLLNLLNKDKITKQGIFNADVVSSLVEQHLKGNVDNSPLLWNLLIFQKWYEKNMNEKDENSIS